VGLSESAAQAAGHDVQVFRSTFRPMHNILAGRDDKTMMKLVIDRTSRKVLGVHMVGADAPEIIQMAAIALTMGATKDDFDRTVAVHPTAAEEFVLMRG
jgi:glutathione reductase (NADPH)